MGESYQEFKIKRATEKSANEHRAVTNKTLLKTVMPYIKTDPDGGVYVKKDIGEFKTGDPLKMVSVKGASLISTDPRSNFSWQKMNAKEVRRIYAAIMKQKKK